MTERIHYGDTYLMDFTANVMEVNAVKDGYAVILDKTAFYPESGGQPCDTGFIAGEVVIKVTIKDGVVIHMVKNEVGLGEAICKVDWERRLDNAQQHTGEHLLSSVIYNTYGGTNNSFHIGDELSSIEVNIPNMTEDMIRLIEERTNDIILENKQIRADFYNNEELQNMPLRKMPKVDENIRVVIIEDNDYSPCGGTQLSTTGQIQLVKIKKWERMGDWYKIEFLCGKRALSDYYNKMLMTNRLVGRLSAREQEIEMAIEKLQENNKVLEKEMITMQYKMARNDTKELLKGAKHLGDARLIMAVVDDVNMSYLKLLGSKIGDMPGHIVVLVNSDENFNLIANKSADIKLSLNEIIKPLFPIIDGRGGGNAQTVQGGGKNAEKINDFFQKIEEEVKKLLQC